MLARHIHAHQHTHIHTPPPHPTSEREPIPVRLVLAIPRDVALRHSPDWSDIKALSSPYQASIKALLRLYSHGILYLNRRLRSRATLPKKNITVRQLTGHIFCKVSSTSSPTVGASFPPPLSFFLPLCHGQFRICISAVSFIHTTHPILTLSK